MDVVASKIKDNSKFNKGQGQGGSNKGLSYEIKDGWQPYIHSVQNNTAIDIATAVKWMAINEECLI